MSESTIKRNSQSNGFKTLLLCEKPSVARDIARVLKDKFNNKDGFLESSGMIITWALGHLLELAMPEVYDPALKRWTANSLPILPRDFILVPRKESLKQLSIIKQLLQRADVKDIINGCDAGREGELIFRYIYTYCQCHKPFMRLWLSETTDKAVNDSFSALRAGTSMENLYYSARARSQADWLVGINATRALSVKYNDKLSVGRVQTPTLALIVARDREIDNFVPHPYFELWAEFVTEAGDTYRGKWFKGKQEQIAASEKADQLYKQFTPLMKGLIKKLQQKESKENPPLLFNLNDLQKLANQKYGLTAEQTLKIAQRLYEAKLLTYPRSDSRYLTKSLALSLPERMQALANTELSPFLKNINGSINSKRYVDNSKVTDHTAIIITAKPPNLQSLSKNEKLIYLLVAQRMLAMFYPPARYSQTAITTALGSETFISKGRVLLDPGWKTISGSESREQTLPFVKEQEAVTLTDLKIEEKQHQPPKRYNEADLLSAMENAGKVLDDKKLKDAMKGKGLGTPATRAAIIEKLIATGYIKREKKSLLATSKGQELIDIVMPRLKDPEMTGEWEKRLSDIEKGQYSEEVFMQEIKQLLYEMLRDVKKENPRPNKSAKLNPGIEAGSLGNCPLCGNSIIEGKKGYGCSGFRSGCKFVIWKNIAGQEISLENINSILQSGRSQLIKGFISKKGTLFDACLRFDGDKIVFDFSKAK
ncbi:MAG: DNA topoisomerase 3 [Syntrophomonadaceae bacterium]|nr:DNA topoisomerase 3 [Syntrophomonadaceae bacterium]MDD3022599.1 DNA topoisomerase 3 [Syntrophomonadaceae bacterium]